MKKSTAWLIAVISLLLFGTLVYQGLKYSRGVPVEIEEPETTVLEIRYLDSNIEFRKGISLDIWDALPATDIELIHQLMILPWGKSLVSPVIVKAFYNDENIYFYMSWKDGTDDHIVDTDRFTDGCAVMFPLNDMPKTASIMMGFTGKTNIWNWKASLDIEFWLKQYHERKVYTDYYYPFEEEELFPISKVPTISAVRDLVSIRVGTITPKEKQNITGRGYWSDGIRYVVFKRKFSADDKETDAVFIPGKKRLCAFAVWNGSQKDRGGRKSTSKWVELDIKKKKL